MSASKISKLLLKFMPKDWPRFSPAVPVALSFSLILHISAAFFSVGYNWFDEYFQIVEFAGYKLGRTPVTSLPWEFGAHARPWLEPWILYTISRGEAALGIHSPATWLFSFQLFGALLGWVALLAVADCAVRWIKDPKRAELAILSLCVFWFFPWFHARTSSENYSSSCFFIGLWLWTARPVFLSAPFNGAILDFVGGMFWGLTFQFRIHVSAMIFGGGVWLLKERKARFWPAALGFVVMLGVGVLFDSWGYATRDNGGWAVSWWNYVRICLLQHGAAGFGTAPWWDYFRMMWVQAPPVLGVIVILICLVMWIKRPKHVATWVTLPIVIAHMVLGHKELRYLFPIAPLVPIFPWLIADASGAGFRKIESVAFKIIFALNVPFLVYGAVTAEKNSFRFLEFIAGHYPNHFELYSMEPDPFEDVQTLYFLRPLDYHFHRLKDAAQLAPAIEASGVNSAYFYYAGPTPQEELSGPLGMCRSEYRTFGPFFRHFDFNHWMERAANWQLLWCGR
jgi:phosphatidylinositol glycan class B